MTFYSMMSISSKKTSARPLRFAFLLLGLIGTSVFGSPSAPDIQPLSSGWKLQDAAKVSATPEQVSQAAFQAADWYPATVPGTVLTTLVNNKVYPEPLYGENNRPDKIPESLCHSSYWYRTSFSVPAVTLRTLHLAQLRRNQLLGRGLGQRSKCRLDEGRIRSRHLRYYPPG